MFELLQNHVHYNDDEDLEMNLLMNDLDLDNDGKLDYCEFL